jgi:anti-sigma B factor antagonist
MDLQCWMEREEDIAVLDLAGEVDLATAPVLRDTIEAAFRQRRRVLVDLADVTYLDGSGLRVLKQAAQDHVGRFAVSASKPQIRRLFELTHLSDNVAVVASLQAGREYLSTRERNRES